MSFATGEVVTVPGPSPTFKVVFTADGQVIGEWPVPSVKEGEKQIVEVLKGPVANFQA